MKGTTDTIITIRDQLGAAEHSLGEAAAVKAKADSGADSGAGWPGGHF